MRVDEEVEPAVVVVVPEPAGEAGGGPVTPSSGATSPNVPSPSLWIEPAGRPSVRDEEVEPAVVVVVAPGRPLGAPLVGHAGRGGDVVERAVAVVVIEPAAGFAGWPGGWRRAGSNSPQTNRSTSRRCRSRPRRPTRSRSARPARRQTSRPRMPSPLFRKSDIRIGFSQAPRSSRTSRSPSLS